MHTTRFLWPTIADQQTNILNTHPPPYHIGLFSRLTRIERIGEITMIEVESKTMVAFLLMRVEFFQLPLGKLER